MKTETFPALSENTMISSFQSISVSTTLVRVALCFISSSNARSSGESLPRKNEWREVDVMRFIQCSTYDDSTASPFVKIYARFSPLPLPNPRPPVQKCSEPTPLRPAGCGEPVAPLAPRSRTTILTNKGLFLEITNSKNTDDFQQRSECQRRVCGEQIAHAGTSDVPP